MRPIQSTCIRKRKKFKIENTATQGLPVKARKKIFCKEMKEKCTNLCQKHHHIIQSLMAAWLHSLSEERGEERNSVHGKVNAMISICQN